MHPKERNREMLDESHAQIIMNKQRMNWDYLLWPSWAMRWADGSLIVREPSICGRLLCRLSDGWDRKAEVDPKADCGGSNSFCAAATADDDPLVSTSVVAVTWPPSVACRVDCIGALLSQNATSYGFVWQVEQRRKTNWQGSTETHAHWQGAGWFAGPDDS